MLVSKQALIVRFGLNRAFWIDSATRAALIAQDAKSAEIIKPLAVGDDVRRWRITEKDRWLIFTRRGIKIDNYPAVKAYLEQWREALEPRPRDWSVLEEWKGRKSGSYKWYELQDNVTYHAFFEQPKIVFPDIAKESRFAFDTVGKYVDMTAFVIPVSNLYLLGVLNSSSVWNYLRQTAAVLGDADKAGRLRLKRIYMQNIPIPTASDGDRAAIVQLVQQCLDAKGQGPQVADWEGEINERVAALYGVAVPKDVDELVEADKG